MIFVQHKPPKEKPEGGEILGMFPRPTGNCCLNTNLTSYIKY